MIFQYSEQVKNDPTKIETHFNHNILRSQNFSVFHIPWNSFYISSQKYFKENKKKLPWIATILSMSLQKNTIKIEKELVL